MTAQETKQAEIEAVRKQLSKVKGDIAVAREELRRFNGYINPEPFKSFAERSLGKFEKEERELTGRLDRITGKDV